MSVAFSMRRTTWALLSLRRGVSGISGQRDPPFINPETGINYGRMLDNTPMQLQAPLKEIADVFRLKGIIAPYGTKPHPVRFLVNCPDEEIVKWYASLMHGMLSYYRSHPKRHIKKSEMM